MEAKLRPIYQAIDSRQYTKAIKLTLVSPQNSWPITIALRCHCLVRCGPLRYKEACMEMRSLVKVFGDDWPELDERIWLLSLDSRSAANSTTATSSSTQGDASCLSLDALDVLDVPFFQRCQRFSSSSSPTAAAATDANVNVSMALKLSDETTLATLAIAMSCLHLHETVSKVYSCAIQTVQSYIASVVKHNTSLKHALDDQLYNLLVKGYLSNLKVISTLVEFSSSSSSLGTLEKIHNEKRTLQAWEEAQFYAMHLVKVSEGERLYSSWMIVAILEHCRSCQRLLTLLEEKEGTKVEETMTDDLPEREKLHQKLNKLPRLAEMMTMKHIQKFVKDGDGGGDGNDNNNHLFRFPPSADDVKVFVECLEMQSKFREAIDFLDQVGERNKSLVVKSRQIEDENDIKHHVGSVIQLTEKERLEMKVKLLNKMNRHDEVFQIYSDELLVMMPDQWSYWKGLLECSTQIATGSESCTMCVHVSSETICRHVLDRVLEQEDKKRLEGKGHKIPLRGPNLFMVELNAHEVRNGSMSACKDLASSIIAYGNIYAPLVHCCFQDLRVYIDLLVNSSCEKGVISDEVKSVLGWALEVQKKSDPLHSSQKVDRKSELRAYIASVKICFEVWYQLCQQCREDDEANQTVDKAMAFFVPSHEDMIRNWVHAMDLGSNPKDGGQKESLPGDDLILLAVQCMNHVHRYDAYEERMKFSTMAAGVLEYAMTYSPYNAYLKIAAMKQHLKNGSTVRAHEVFEKIDIKQIQLESCSYFILNDLVNSGLYKEALEQAGKILNLHSTSEKDLCSFMPRAFENGNISKGLEMIRWQRQQMSTSFQLLEAKGIIMDLAPFLGFESQNNGHASHDLGSRCGLVGGQEEGERAEKILRDSANFYAAPSILNLARGDNNIENCWSDNRDFTVNDYEILERSMYEFHPIESISRAHEHCILTKMVMVSQVMKPPKKGKVVKVSEGEVLDKRSKSLLQSIDAAESFFANEKCRCNQSHKLLLRAATAISRAFCVIATGRHDAVSSPSPSDKLEEREEKAIPMLQSAKSMIQGASSSWTAQSKAVMSSLTFRLVPDVVIMLLASLNICENACSVFGWGKRKRSTKPVANCIADLALCFKTFLTDISTSMEYKENIIDIDERLSQVLDLLPNSHDLIKKMVHNCSRQNNDVHGRINVILMQMIDELNTFNVND